MHNIRPKTATSSSHMASTKFKKHTFLLLELLIAMSLLCICILPLVQLPFNALSTEIKSYQRLQLKRLADITFADVQAQLFQNAISWEELSSTRSEKTQLKQDILTVKLEGIGKREFERTCSIWTSRRKAGKNLEQYRLLTLEIKLKALHDSHFFQVKQKTSNTTVFRYQIFVSQGPASLEKKLA